MKDAVIVSLLSLVPRNRGARMMGWLARTRASRLGTRLFVRVYGVDMHEAEPAEYPSLEALFTRRLRADARPVDGAPGALVSPVDGTVAAVGLTEGGRIEVAPGRPLDVAALIGEPVTGEVDVAVIYLSPKDYHRVHVPREGVATAWRYLPGTLWPVFPAAVRKVDHLFSKNERLSVRVETDHGPMWVVLVGAFGVGRISSAVCPVISNTSDRSPKAGACATAVARGGDLGVFHLGSTVVLVSPPGAWRYAIAVGDKVRMGERIGSSAPRLTGA